jgi:predicted transcriptional regulator
MNTDLAITHPGDDTMKTMSLRIDDEQARALDAVAAADKTSVSEVIREAITDRIEARRNDKDFQARLREVVEESREALELLAK